MTDKISWSKIRSLSLTMAGLADDEKWEELVDVERNRNDLIHSFFDQNEANAVTEQDILDILEIDKIIMEKCLYKRKSIGEKLRLFNQSRRAKNAYLGNR